jgi:hypothetical protein
MKNVRQPIYFTSIHGKNQVRLPLANNRGEAVFDRSVFEGLINLGYSSQMRLTSTRKGKTGYVRTRHPEIGACGLTRAITGARKDQHIHYRDGNRENLTLENLVVVERGGGFNSKCPLCQPQDESQDYMPKRRTRRRRKGKSRQKIPQISVRSLVISGPAITPRTPMALIPARDVIGRPTQILLNLDRGDAR